MELLEQRVVLATFTPWLLPGELAMDFTLPNSVAPLDISQAYTLSDDPADIVVLHFGDRTSSEGDETIAQLQQVQDWIDAEGIDANIVVADAVNHNFSRYWQTWMDDVEEYRTAHNYTMDFILDDVYLYTSNGALRRERFVDLRAIYGGPADRPVWWEYGAWLTPTTFVISQQAGFQVVEATHVGWDADLVETLKGEIEHWNQWPALPAVSISDAAVTESDTESRRLTFDVTLSAPSADPVTLSYDTEEVFPFLEREEDYIAIDGRDFRRKSKQLTFAPGQTSKTISVTVRGDTSYERPEFFCVRLTDVTDNARFSERLALGTITDNDKRPRVSINDVRIKEGQTGRRKVTFTVSLSGTSHKKVTVRYTTEDFTAVESDDYLYESGSVKFQKGATRKRVSVWVLGDRQRERTESFVVNLHDPTHSALGDARGVARILDNDRNRSGATAAFQVSSSLGKSFSLKPLAGDDLTEWLDELLVLPR